VTETDESDPDVVAEFGKQHVPIKATISFKA